MRAEFDDTLITGNEMIDSQHKELIEKMIGLLDSCEDGNDKLTAVKTLHEKLRKAVDELHEMLIEEEGPTPAFVEQVHQNVIDWLYRHIKGFDRSVAEYRFMRGNSENL